MSPSRTGTVSTRMFVHTPLVSDLLICSSGTPKAWERCLVYSFMSYLSRRGREIFRCFLACFVSSSSSSDLRLRMDPQSYVYGLTPAEMCVPKQIPLTVHTMSSESTVLAHTPRPHACSFPVSTQKKTCWLLLPMMVQVLALHLCVIQNSGCLLLTVCSICFKNILSL